MKASCSSTDGVLAPRGHKRARGHLQTFCRQEQVSSDETEESDSPTLQALFFFLRKPRGTSATTLRNSWEPELLRTVSWAIFCITCRLSYTFPWLVSLFLHGLSHFPHVGTEAPSPRLNFQDFASFLLFPSVSCVL